MRASYLLAIPLLGGTVGADAHADTVRIGDANITEKSERFGRLDVDWRHTIKVHNKSDDYAITKVTKTIPNHPPSEVDQHGKPGWLTDKIGVDLNGDGTEESTQITWWGGSLAGASRTKKFSFDTEIGTANLPFTSNHIKIVAFRASTAEHRTYEGDVSPQKREKSPGTPRTPDAKSRGNSVAFNAGILSFDDDYITTTGYPSDPIVGAAVDVPDFDLVGPIPGTNQILFEERDDEYLTFRSGTDVFLKANVSFITYDIDLNLFFADLFDFKLAGVDPASPHYGEEMANGTNSPYLQEVERVMSPGARYVPGTVLYFTFTPDVNFGVATSGFTAAASSPGDNGTRGSTPVPEPGSVLTLLGACVVLKRRR